MQFLSGSSRFFPSKRVGALVVIIAGLIVAVVIAEHDAVATIDDDPAVRLAGEQVAVNETDTDGDGVKDWEEALWGLSAVSPDTDADGVGDADEITVRQRVLAEQRTGLLESIGDGTASFDENDTKTDVLSKVLFEQLINFKTAGIPVDGNVATQISDAIAPLALSTEVEKPPIKATDISIVTASDTAVRAYGNGVGSIFKGPSTASTNELFLLAQYGNDNNPETLKGLATVADHYDAMRQELLELSVPEDVAATHLSLLNTMVVVADSLRSIATLNEDSLSALLAFKTYLDASTTFISSLQGISVYLAGNASFFSEGDDARVIINLSQ